VVSIEIKIVTHFLVCHSFLDMSLISGLTSIYKIHSSHIFIYNEEQGNFKFLVN